MDVKTFKIRFLFCEYIIRDVLKKWKFLVAFMLLGIFLKQNAFEGNRRMVLGAFVMSQILRALELFCATRS